MPIFCRFATTLALLLVCGLSQGQDLNSFLSPANTQLSAAQLQALSDFSIEVDTVMTDIGILSDGTDLTGFNTYRVYINTSSSDDVIGALFGSDGAPLHITSTGTFYQEQSIGSATPNAINPM